MDAFDADVLIYASKQDPRGDSAARLLAAGSPEQVIGSIVLVSEVFLAPVGGISDLELQRLVNIVSAIELKDVTYEIADLAGTLRSKYRLRTPDALHLATAVVWGADRFHTNNRKDFGQAIDEIEIVFP